MHSKRTRNNANLGVCKEIIHNIRSAGGGLTDGRVTEAELLKQESVVPKHVCGVSGTRERRDRISLGIMVISSRYGLV